jgi:hypothetical protein
MRHPFEPNTEAHSGTRMTAAPLNAGANALGELAQAPSDALSLTRALFGPFARHVPMWMIVQHTAADSVCFVGASRDLRLRYGSTMTHQLILGELIVRPHFVVESDEFRGLGIAGLLTQAPDLDEWTAHGRIVCDPIGRFANTRVPR